MEIEITLDQLAAEHLGALVEVYAVGPDESSHDAYVEVGPQPFAPTVAPGQPAPVISQLYIRVLKLDDATLLEVRNRLEWLRAAPARTSSEG